MTTQKNNIDYVVIPALEPSKTLITLVQSIVQLGYHVLLVDDGSTPACQPIWDALKNSVILLHHTHNQGKGAALKTAFRYLADQVSDAGCIVTMDADGQHLPEDMEAVCFACRKHPDSLILGVRQFKNNIPARSLLGNRITRVVFQTISGAKVSDTQTGLRAFQAGLLEKMLEIPGERYEYEMNMLLTCGRDHIPMEEVPIHTVYLDAKNSVSHFQPLTDSARIYKTLFKFASCSFISFLVDYGAFLALTATTASLPGSLIISNIAARILSGGINYTLNKHAVFHGNSKTSETLPQYILLATGILVANSLILTFFTSILGMPAQVSKLLTEFSLFLISFTVQTQIIFRGKKKKGGETAHV